MDIVEIKPQKGFQEKFLSSPADIVIGGGAAGAGKTYALEMDPLRHLNVPGFKAVIFRRTSEQIRKAGGPWDESFNLYPHARGNPNSSSLVWKFPTGARISFGHIQYEKDLAAWDGSQIAAILFDQLESFSEKMFFYMMSRNRSACGVRPYIKASCNPLAGSWLAEFLTWWIDQDTGYAIPERSGAIRWMTRIKRNIYWHGTREESAAHCVAQGVEPQKAEAMPKSVTFVPGLLSDNKILMEKDPGYESNMLALDKYERDRLLGGNWKQRPDTGEFPMSWVENKWFDNWPTDESTILKILILDPSKGKADRDGDYQAYIKLAIDRHDQLFVQADMQRRPIDQMVSDGVDIYKGFKPTAFGIEGNAWQDLLKPDFEGEFKRQNVLTPVIYTINNSVNKEVRIRRLGGYLSQDRIRFKRDCPGTALLIDQLLDFPKGKHDDGPDALEMAIRLASDITIGSS